MKTKDNRPGYSAELRERAEEVVREKAALLPEKPEALTPEETRQIIHELRVHQIELEMQNDELRRAQLELDASRARYFDLYDLAPVGYVTLSEKGVILEANLTAATLLGLTRGGMVKQTISRFIIKEDQDIYYRHGKQLFEAGEPQAFELRMVKKDGTSFWAHLEASTTKDAGGAPVHRVVITDITERKFLEDERELTARLILLVNTPGDFRERMSELIYSLQYWSGCEAVGIRLRSGDDYPYYETLGFPPAFVNDENHLCIYGPEGNIQRDGTGNPVLECMCGNVLCGRFDPARPFFTTHGSFWTNSAIPFFAGADKSDRQARTRNRCNVEGYKSVALIPLSIGNQFFGLLQFNDRRPDRFTPGLVAHLERVADSLAIALSQRQTEIALLKSESRYRNIFGELPVAIWEEDLSGVKSRLDELSRSGVTDFRSYFNNNPDEVVALAAMVRVLEVNQRSVEMLGAKRSTQVIREFPRYFTVDSLPVIREEMIALAEGRTAFHSEIPVADSNGEYLLLDMALSIPSEHAHDLSRVLVSFTDITSRKKNEEELMKAEKLESVGILAGGIAHDFNNILTSITGNISMARMQVKPGQKIFDLLNSAEASSIIAQGLTRQLLTFAKGGEPVKKIASIQNIIRESSVFVLRGSKTECEFKIAEDLWPVEADVEQIGQAISNIVMNANQAMNEEGIVRITAWNIVLDEKQGLPVKPGKYIRISINDNGAGIAQNNLSKIFEPYFTTKNEGSGLGLATAYSIIKKHNGHISVDSFPGAWTVFEIYLPASGNEIPVKESPELLKGRGKILVMDDDKLLKELMGEMLGMLGYESEFAKNGDETIEMYKNAKESEKPYDAVILDLTIPGGMGGKQAIEILLKTDPEIKAIVYSGYSDDPVMSKYREYGFKGMIAKPFDIYALGKVLNDVLFKEDYLRTPFSKQKSSPEGPVVIRDGYEEKFYHENKTRDQTPE
jgi:PAS domain S-box-containing protein